MFIIQGKEKPMSRFIFRFETQNINTSREIFYSFIPMINETTDMEMQSKCILRQFWNTLAEYFWNTGSKIGSFVMYLSWHQNTLEWINSPPLTPPFCLIRPLIYKFFKLPHYSVFWNLHTPSPICNWRVQTMRLLLSLMSKSQGKENVIRGFNI